jgi:hypothetical protein
MRIRKNKHAEENVTSLLSTMDRQAVAPDQEFLKRLRERSAREFTAGAPDGSTNTPKSIHIATLGRIIMRSPLTKLAAAAVVVIACWIGLSLWRTTGSGIALADVLAQIEKVKSARSQVSYKITGGNPNKPDNVEMRHTSLTSREYGCKYSIELLDPNGEWIQVSERYFSPQKKTEIFIYPTEKICMCQELEDAQVEKIQQEENTARDPFGFLKEVLNNKYESLGRSTIDGVEVAGFRITDPNWFINIGKNQQVDYKIWADVKTLLPVRYDILASAEVDKMGDRVTHHFVIHNFQWDVPVAAADFEPPISDGYTVRVSKLPPGNEETAIQGLKLLVELLGKYPENIIGSDPRNTLDLTVLQLVEKSETPAALRLKEELKGLTEGKITIKRVDFLMPIRGLERFGRRLQWDKKDPAYYGKTVTPKDADKVLLRWKVSDKEYRVIFGDLHAETVSPEKLAELEKALPK